jgi:hypothetical protein
MNSLKMNNLPILILVGLLVLSYFWNPFIKSVNGQNEKFATSGLAISDRYCDKLVSVYNRPKIVNPELRKIYGKRICGNRRHNTVDYRTGNYFTENGTLI